MKTRFLLVARICVGLTFILSSLAAAQAADIVLAWDANTETDLSGYRLYYGPASRTYTTTINVGNVTTYTVSLGPGTYFFAVTAVNSSGLESGYSNEETTTITGPAPPDTTPPVISQVAAANIGLTSATVTWTTDEPSDSQVDYGTSASYGQSTPLNTTRVTAHSVALGGLAPGTLYHYRVRSADANGNPAVSGDRTFTTGSAPPACSYSISPTTRSIDAAAATGSITVTTAAGCTWTAASSASWLAITSGSSGSGTGTVAYSASANTATASRAGTVTVAGRAFTLTQAGAPPDVSATHPADLNANSRIEIDEVTAYGAAWKTGSSWSRPPNPIPIEYVTNSGLIWIAGETYRSDPSQTPPWVPGGSNEPAAFFETSSGIDRVLAGTGSATSSFSPAAYRPGEGVRVSISVTPGSGTSVYALEDTPPSNWVISEITNDGTFVNGEVKWGPFFDSTSRTLRYTATPPSGESATRTFSGTASFDGTNFAIGGSRTIGLDTTPIPTTPPAITSVGASNITGSRATITWTTDRASDSQVQYGRTESYGSTTPLQSSRVTRHTVNLTGLTPRTLYHYRVRSKDEFGNQGISGDFTFTTADPDIGAIQSTLFYPHVFTAGPPIPGSEDQDFTGVAVANLDTRTMTLRFTALDARGARIEGASITNPVVHTLAPGQQLSLLNNELFGAGLGETDSVGSIKVESTLANLAGFFLMFDGELRVLDGANLFAPAVMSFVFPEIEDQGFTRVNIVNPDPAAAALTIDLVAPDGAVRATAVRSIEAGGALIADAFQELFPGIQPAGSDYIRVASDKGVLPFELFGKAAQFIEGLGGQNAALGSSSLHCPQFVTGGPWRSTISVVNLDRTAGSVGFRFLRDDGTQIGSTRSLPIAAGGKIYIDDQEFFAPSDGSVAQGYVEITSSGVKLTGSVAFGDPDQSVFGAALPLVSQLQRSVVFSHVASNDLYFTGVAIANPNDAEAVATIDVYGADGTLEYRTTEHIGAKRRIARLLTELFPSLEGQDRTEGYIRISVDQDAAMFALFGTRNGSVLSAIPAQPR